MAKEEEEEEQRRKVRRGGERKNRAGVGGARRLGGGGRDGMPDGGDGRAGRVFHLFKTVLRLPEPVHPHVQARPSPPLLPGACRAPIYLPSV